MRWDSGRNCPLLASETAGEMPEGTDDVVRDAWEHGSIRETSSEWSPGMPPFIISNCRGAEDVIRLYTMARMPAQTRWYWISCRSSRRWTTWQALRIGRILFDAVEYREHVAQRQNVQHVMLFSDGTKDGGYLRANWSIHQ